MKSNKKIILVVSVLILILFTAACEMGLINFNLHKTKTSNTFNSKWNSNKATYNSKHSFEQKGDAPSGIIVKYDSKIIGDLDSKNPITIDISDSDLGIVWLPFYKYSDYEVLVDFKTEYSIKKDSTISDYSINGEINTSGKLKIFGISSYSKAKNMILDKIMNAVYEDVIKNIEISQPTNTGDNTLLL